MIDPISTYRIQFNKEFNFKNFKSVIPYLYELGIKTIYASPIYKAVPGSNHGYDVTDPNQINPEIGTLAELRSISKILKSYEMYWIQDIVPNHMGFHQDNAWLMDVLQKGDKSTYRQYFDLVTTDLKKDPIMVPFLGDDLDKVIDNNQLELIERKGTYYLKYFDNSWPIQTLRQPKKSNIKEIANGQYYRLCNYRETNSKINYRRFFTVNSLICLNMQLEPVFKDYHQLTKQLLGEGVFQGLRIDHVDGLANPTAYLNQLRQLCGNEVYIVVEKILEPNEELPKNWPIQGSTGYDYLGFANQLFTSTAAKADFEKTYERFAGKQARVEDQILIKKKDFLDKYMQGELENLYQLTLKLWPANKPAQKNHGIKELIASILINLPIYRSYNNEFDVEKNQKTLFKKTLSELEKEGEYKAILPEFKKLLLDPTKEDNNGISYFNRLMQFTGPLMAKGVEDTLMYTYNRFIGNNEVGDSPVHFGMEVTQFHQKIETRGKQWPLSMNATATHDTKRSEDSRSRLSALTEYADKWRTKVMEWEMMNQGLKTGSMPDKNDEYFIYQTLLATCSCTVPNQENYPERLLAYIAKALRESKRQSNWDQPNVGYEKATQDFVSKLIDPNGSFWKSFYPFLQKIAKTGKIKSLSSLVLKHTVPGIPDTYQGTEFFDLSMVDPDNRRSVDYNARSKSLALLENKSLEEALQLNDYDEKTKLQLLQQLLHYRKQHHELFAKGDYQPLVVVGDKAEQVIAYTRHYHNECLLVIIPQHRTDENNLNELALILPATLRQAEVTCKHVLAQEKTKKITPDQNGKVSLKTMLDGLPFVIYHFTIPDKARSAGILMHLTSLPTNYGIGDLGPSAHRFLDFLAEAKMKYWQVLPMNPITADQSFSPYSSTSAMAGNSLLISPEELAEWGLITDEDLSNYQLKDHKKVNYQKAVNIKSDLLKKAYRRWQSASTAVNMLEFEDFCKKQSEWLNDYALFVLISSLERGKAWYHWPNALKQRQADALHQMTNKYAAEIKEIKWQQFVFFRQWKTLKNKANTLNIKIIGDLPFYCAHNSADVWANPKLFAVDKAGQVTGVAGVPPDYFNADGQLWGMPVYNWKAMNEESFEWWKKRMAMNLSLYDKIRLDHFRAFDEYWEVPANSETAKAGSWKKGPQKAFFDALEKSLGKMPLIAEDLGEITNEVYQLRDDLALPGMKVLQFAFGSDMSQSVHIPHQYQNSNGVIYTGTHDNNTTRGWFKQDIDIATRNRIERYLGCKINDKTIAAQLIRLAFASIAEIAIIPMQDFLNQPASQRMNTPASVNGNWTWKLETEDFYQELAKNIASLASLFNR